MAAAFLRRLESGEEARGVRAPLVCRARASAPCRPCSSPPCRARGKKLRLAQHLAVPGVLVVLADEHVNAHLRYREQLFASVGCHMLSGNPVTTGSSLDGPLPHGTRRSPRSDGPAT